MLKQGLTVLAMLGALTACAGGPRSGVATNPPLSSGSDGNAVSSASAGPGAAQTSGVRTVLSPLGLNIRSDPSTSATRLSSAAQGAQLTVTGHSDQNGGWYAVRGATVTGWITADPALSAPGTFVGYNSTDRGFSLLYPANWTFAEEAAAVVFKPQSGTNSVVVRNAPSVAALGSAASGYGNSGDTQIVVCGVTGDLLTYDQAASTTATPLSAAAPLLSHLARVRLKLDETHALSIDFNYATPGELTSEATFYDSMTFPFPQCQKSTPDSAAAPPSPT